MPSKKHLRGMTLDELKEVARECGFPGFTAKQIADWIYKKRVRSIDEMSNISVAHRNKLSENYTVGEIPASEKKISGDGTIKYLFPAKTGKFIETVMIPDKDRYTLCVSSQVGCKFNCLFCMTGKQGFNGNLIAHEILNQIFSVEEADKLTNIVFMGMGEPLDNYKEVKKTLDIITSDYGLAWSPKRITVSTTGIIPELKKFLEESNAHLAVSLHSPFHDKRLSLMPVEKAYPAEKILNLLRQYDWTKQRRLSFEYIIFDGINDSIVDAKELVRKIKGLECRVNLIRFHAIPDVDIRSSEIRKMEKFKDYLNSKGIICTIRSSRGEDIFAACGMLSSNTKNKEKTIS